jgi:hypothetical protein
MRTLVLSMLACSFFLACNPDDCPVELLYELPFSLLNPSDTISVGDTLWYESKFDNILIDKNGNIGNNFRDYDFTFLFSYVIKIDSTIEQGGGFNLEIIQQEGFLKKFTYSDGYEVYDLNYQSDSNGHLLRYGVVWNVPGLYTIQIGYLDTEKKVKTNCTSHAVIWHFLLNETDTNFEMLQSSPIPFWQNYKRSNWDRFASYCVYVKP